MKGKGKGVHVECETSKCDSPIFLGLVDKHTGSLNWTKYNKKGKLVMKIKSLITEGNITTYGFCFLKCLKLNQADMYRTEIESNDISYIPDEDLISHVLVLPSPRKKRKGVNFQTHHKDTNKTDRTNKLNTVPNINLVLLDSISRSHFYRSLPKTIKVFNHLNQQFNKNQNSSMVLDFELVQAMKARTFETMQALFTGYVDVNEKPFGVLAMPPKPLGTSVLMGGYKVHGHRTMWLEDLCWAWEWGISKDIKAYNKSLSRSDLWKDFVKALNRSDIDDVDFSLSTCEIFRSLNINDHFHGPDAVCYGNRYQHEYILEYLQIYQEQLLESGQGFFTFTGQSVGHDETGRRIQTMDQHLAKYVEFAQSLDNTVTIIFADHGNTYGTFPERSFEGKIEMFQPSLFIILPKSVQDLLKNKRLNWLINNQFKLVSYLDVHYLLRYLGKIKTDDKYLDMKEQFGVASDGLLSHIPEKRTCHNMPRLMPNFCICEGFDNAVSNNSMYEMYGHFAVAKLNEMLQNSYRGSSMIHLSMYGHCQRLHMKLFQNVHTTIEKVLGFNIYPMFTYFRKPLYIIILILYIAE